MKIKQGKTPCPCCSGQTLEQCCGPYIYTTAKAPDAVALMRSRYTANVKKAFKYLADTWHQDNRPAKMGAGKANWLKLEVVDSKLEEDKAWVEFKAYYGHADHMHSFHEKSFFVRENNEWLYVDGDILEQDHCGHHHH
ncbi:MAG TPA: hypothetical protein DHW71_02590 [Gammaproteobacteria bacterium]|nr:hypothetical protein [Gammaproteobacteria bacterium]MEC8010846.1 YchJ family metal-binding protein [Pseudomonadota bacterium]HBF07165.1 hypothetical protein [Gammaproteobacteria bacterium]HCK91844.1 hypothetical protein [Gammaproteobacteria bacterium]|tara:strand:+ start:1088 stop:1501 length:414 start_codon:yes stop_codon:yes gene_type:complete